MLKAIANRNKTFFGIYKYFSLPFGILLTPTFRMIFAILS